MNGDEGPPLQPPGGGEQQQDQDGSQPAPSLPEDVLADIFRRLAPRWIAASRCVNKSWCASIDTRRLLRADLLPLSLRGMFVHFCMHKFPAFFSRPAPPGAPAFSGKLSFLPSAKNAGCVWNPDESYDSRERYSITDHCNGLLLIDKYVVNPATRRWDALPPAPPGRVQFTMSTDRDPDEKTPISELIDNYLVFDPTVSAHYQVLRICALSRMGSMDDLRKKDSECPSSSCTLNVFSSRSGCWEERHFVREGDAAGTFAGVRSRPQSGAVYWRGALYVHRESHFVLRISLSSNTYRVIKPPPMYGADSPVPCLQRSEKGVYFVSFDRNWIQVWILKESCGQTKWELKHDRDLEPVLARRRLRQVHGPWMLKGINHNSFCTHFPEDNNEDVVEDKFEWSSDSDDVPDNEGTVQECSFQECYSNNDSDDVLVNEKVQDCSSEQCYSINGSDAVFDNEDAIEGCSSDDNKKAIFEDKFESNSNDDMAEECYWIEDICEIDMLGLHPFKEVLFLCESAKTGLAYHLNSSKIECLGDIYPTDYVNYGGYGYDRDEMDRVKYAFPYTPCWIEEFPRNN